MTQLTVIVRIIFNDFSLKEEVLKLLQLSKIDRCAFA